MTADVGVGLNLAHYFEPPTPCEIHLEDGLLKPALLDAWSSSRPTRPARCTSATPGGRRSATRAARMLRGGGRRRRPRSTTSTTAGDQMDMFGASLEPRPSGQPGLEDGYGRQYIARHRPTAWSGPTPRACRRCPPRGAARRVPGAGAAAEARRAARPAADLRHRLRHLVLRALAARERGGLRDAALAEGEGPHLRGGRRRADADHRLRGRQGPGADQVQRREDLLRQRHRVLPQQAERGATTAASTCSAPTTTGTSAGCGRWRPARATTPTGTSRC